MMKANLKLKKGKYITDCDSNHTSEVSFIITLGIILHLYAVFSAPLVKNIYI